jgi:hypothetical protein
MNPSGFPIASRTAASRSSSLKTTIVVAAGQPDNDTASSTDNAAIPTLFVQFVRIGAPLAYEHDAISNPSGGEPMILVQCKQPVDIMGQSAVFVNSFPDVYPTDLNP